MKLQTDYPNTLRLIYIIQMLMFWSLYFYLIKQWQAWLVVVFFGLFALMAWAVSYVCARLLPKIASEVHKEVVERWSRYGYFVAMTLVVGWVFYQIFFMIK